MTERNIALRAKLAGNGSRGRLPVLALLCGGLLFGVTSQASAEPTENSILFNCTFTAADLENALTIPDLNSLNSNGETGHLEASYIIIYVRQNPNDGQRIGLPGSGSYTGPVLCANSETDHIATTNEGAALTGVNILGAEEASHLQLQPSTGEPGPNDTTKRVCHTVASKTECFLITKLPPAP